MKKFIAMLVLLAMCFGGCAQAEPIEHSDTAELPTTNDACQTVITNDVTTLFDETYVPDNDILPEVLQAQMNEGLISYGRAFTKMLQFENVKMENVAAAFICDANRLIFAWIMAEEEPSVGATRMEDTVAIDRQRFEDFHALLFGDVAETEKFDGLETDWCRFELEDGYIFAHYKDHLQGFPAVIKADRLAYTEEPEADTGSLVKSYTLTADVLVSQQTYEQDGKEYYRLGTDHEQYAEPALTSYPDDAVAARMQLIWCYTEGRWVLAAYEMTLCADGSESASDEEESAYLEKYDGTTLFEAIDLMPVNETPSEEAAIAMQYALDVNARVFIPTMQCGFDDFSKARMDHDFLSEPEGKMTFLWHSRTFRTFISGESQEIIDGEGYVLYTAQELQEYARLYLGEEIDAATIEQTPVYSGGENSPPQIFDDGLGARVELFSGSGVFKNPMLRYDAETDEYTLTAEICTAGEGKFFELADTPTEHFAGVLHVGLKKADGGYRFTSVMLTDVFGKVPEQDAANPELNRFLSYLSRYHMGTYDPEARPELINFAYNCAMSLDEHFGTVGADETGEFYYIPCEDVDNILNKFFGRSIEHGEVSRRLYGILYTYRDDCYYRPWGFENRNAAYTVTGPMQDNGDGTYDVCFYVVAGQAESSFNLTLAEAREKKVINRGTATVRMIEEEYKIVSYRVYDSYD